MVQKATWTKDVALTAMRRWCAAQERCHEQIRSKLIEHKVYGDALDQVLTALIDEGFLNESRYAKSYARGKFKMNHWGKTKIIQQLKFKKISPYNINLGLKEIEDQEYQQVIIDLATKKAQLLHKETNGYAKFQKIVSYLQQKGFEYELVKNLLEDEGFLHKNV